ncbi:hypothetical protein HNV12_03735 [Methanococcoides sp. SA1]|nr:hypothetical protein [Methanococcoides sp. SA1]
MSLDNKFLEGASVESLRGVSLDEFYERAGAESDIEKNLALYRVDGLKDYLPVDIAMSGRAHSESTYLKTAYQIGCLKERGND